MEINKLSPDAQYIMLSLYEMVDMMFEYDEKHPSERKVMDKYALAYFTNKLERGLEQRAERMINNHG